jgi:hypothetical protein
MSAALPSNRVAVYEDSTFHAYPDTAHAIACRSHDPQISRETHWASRLDHRKSDKGMVP